MTHTAAGEEAASSPPALAAAFPALGRGLALGNGPHPCKSVVAPRNADPLERLLCVKSAKAKVRVANICSSFLLPCPDSAGAKALELGDGDLQG